MSITQQKPRTESQLAALYTLFKQHKDIQREQKIVELYEKYKEKERLSLLQDIFQRESHQ